MTTLRDERRYTVRHPVDVVLGRYEDGAGGYAFGLSYLESADPAEAALLDPDAGEYACWDAAVEFKDGALVATGREGPSGYGGGALVVLTIPQGLIRSLRTEDC
jgi:hypothetical protein